MCESVRVRGLVAWAHLYFLLTFRWWSGILHSFSSEGLHNLRALPVWYFEWLPRLSRSAVQTSFQLLALVSLAGMFLAYREDTRVRAQLLLWPLLIAKFYFYLLDLRRFATYHHMHILLVLLLLCSRNKLFFMRMGLFFIYLWSGLGKLTDSWLKGAYFRSLETGPPLLEGWPVALTMASLAVVALELVGPWCWLSGNKTLRRVSLGAFFVFHLYSGVIVGFHYTVLMIPVLVLALYPLDEPAQHGYSPQRSDLIPALILLVGTCGSLAPFLIAGDVRYTAQGRYFGMSNMFDANRTLLFEATFEKDGDKFQLQISRPYPKTGFYGAQTVVLMSQNDQPFRHLSEELLWEDQVLLSPELFKEAHLRIVADPYIYWYTAQQICGRLAPEHLSMSLKAGLNGEPELQTVFELQEVCPKPPSYSPWGNNWIVTRS